MEVKSRRSSIWRKWSRRARVNRNALRWLFFAIMMFLVFWWRAAEWRSVQVHVEPHPTSPIVNKRQRRRRRRKHLYEICPNLVKTIPAPYANPYVHTVETSLPRSIPKLTKWIKGNIPVILSVPHGASSKDSTYAWQSKHLPVRAGGAPGAVFNASEFQSRLSRVSTDTNTQLIAQEVLSTMKKRYGIQPYVVMAHFHRKFIDVNRRVNGSKVCCQELWPKCTAVADYTFFADGQPDVQWAVKVNTARKVYDEYHSKIIESINEIAEQFPGKPVWLIDVHAQKATDDEEVGVRAEDMLDSIIVGTQDGRLVQSREELYSPGGLLHNLQSGGGVRVFPPSNEVSDHPKYNGGHLVAEYGFSNTQGVVTNALQFEFGFNLRMKSKSRSKVVDALAQALYQVVS